MDILAEFQTRVRIDPSEVVELARDLIRIPSENPPGGEKEIAEYLGAQMQAMGMKVQVKDIAELVLDAVVS